MGTTAVTSFEESRVVSAKTLRTAYKHTHTIMTNVSAVSGVPKLFITMYCTP